MRVVNLSEKNKDEVVNVLCNAFYNYPVMRYVLGKTDAYDNQIKKLINFFVSARVFRNEPMIGIYTADDELAAAAVVTLPEEIPSPKELLEMREKLWNELGAEAKSHYEDYGKTASGLIDLEPHHHLNMIGVKKSYQGKGLSRKLISAVEELAFSHPLSTGVSLSTESEANVKLYLHLGYKLLGNTKVDENIETWAFFKSKR